MDFELLLYVGEDDSFSRLQQGEVVWIREDGLAPIIDTFASEIPFKKDGHSVAEVEHDLLYWLKVPVLDTASRWR